MTTLRTILYPTDFSPRSEYAFGLACSLARDHGSRLIVLHVIEQPVFAYPGVMTAPPPPLPSAEERQALRAKLDEIRPDDETIPVVHLLVQGDPSLSILQIAKEHPCDLIVMGTHGRTGLGRLLMGSVAEEVLRKASCPVLTVKAPSSAVSPKESSPAESSGVPVGAP
jgi:nucleotide-binding universal stress UspA family protein